MHPCRFHLREYTRVQKLDTDRFAKSNPSSFTSLFLNIDGNFPRQRLALSVALFANKSKYVRRLKS